MDKVSLSSRQRMFHKAGATEEKACSLGPTKHSSLVDGTCSMPSLLSLMGWADVIRELRPSLEFLTSAASHSCEISPGDFYHLIARVQGISIDPRP